MKVILTGSSGLVGGAFCRSARANGTKVIRLVRSSVQLDTNAVVWNPETGSTVGSAFEGADAVVHLAGENIAAGRWTRSKKERILRSRINSTRAISETITNLRQPPRVLICASAIGYYGHRGEEVLTETSPVGTGFLADVCRAWEAAADPARQRGIRVVHLRFGMILAADGGALAKMLPPFRLGAGGIIGNGRQYWSWVTLPDVVRAIEFAISNEALIGAVNVVSPQPVTNREFTQTLGAVLQRPTFLPMPAFAARLALGGMADELLLASTRVEPTRLTAAGYKFQHPQLKEALHALLD